MKMHMSGLTFDWHGWRWFNVSGPHLRFGRVRLRLWNLFNRQTNVGDHFWGIGVLQVGNRHLFCVAHSGVSVLFFGRIP